MFWDDSNWINTGTDGLFGSSCISVFAGTIPSLPLLVDCDNQYTVHHHSITVLVTGCVAYQHTLASQHWYLWNKQYPYFCTEVTEDAIHHFICKILVVVTGDFAQTLSPGYYLICWFCRLGGQSSKRMSSAQYYIWGRILLKSYDRNLDHTYLASGSYYKL